VPALLDERGEIIEVEPAGWYLANDEGRVAAYDPDGPGLRCFGCNANVPIEPCGAEAIQFHRFDGWGGHSPSTLRCNRRVAPHRGGHAIIERGRIKVAWDAITPEREPADAGDPASTPVPAERSE